MSTRHNAQPPPIIPSPPPAQMGYWSYERAERSKELAHVRGQMHHSLPLCLGWESICLIAASRLIHFLINFPFQFGFCSVALLSVIIRTCKSILLNKRNLLNFLSLLLPLALSLSTVIESRARLMYTNSGTLNWAIVLCLCLVKFTWLIVLPRRTLSVSDSKSKMPQCCHSWQHEQFKECIQQEHCLLGVSTQRSIFNVTASPG